MGENIEKIVGAAKRYLELRGMDIVGETTCEDVPVLVAEDEDEIVFVYVFDEIKERPFDHGNFAKLLCEWAIYHDMGECAVRADSVAMNVIGTSRAIIQHRVGWQND